MTIILYSRTPIAYLDIDYPQITILHYMYDQNRSNITKCIARNASTNQRPDRPSWISAGSLPYETRGVDSSYDVRYSPPQVVFSYPTWHYVSRHQILQLLCFHQFSAIFRRCQSQRGYLEFSDLFNSTI